MADYYTQFSTGIYRITPEERPWIERQLDAESWESSPPEWAAPLEEGSVDFEWSFEPTGAGNKDRTGDTYLWIRSSERGDPGQAADFAQAFLREFRPAEFFAMTYARTCSKPEPDAFGGGAFYVTADDCLDLDADSWVAGMRREHRASPARPGPTRAADGDGDNTGGGDACPAMSAEAITPSRA